MLVGCGLYCVLSSEHREGGGPGSPEDSDPRPQHGLPLPAQFFSGTALGGDGPLCTCSEERRKLNLAG